jgi:hypothetical protein
MFQVFHIEKLIYKHQNPNKYRPAFISPVNQLILTLYISRVKAFSAGSLPQSSYSDESTVY